MKCTSMDHGLSIHVFGSIINNDDNYRYNIVVDVYLKLMLLKCRKYLIRLWYPFADTAIKGVCPILSGMLGSAP